MKMAKGCTCRITLLVALFVSHAAAAPSPTPAAPTRSWWRLERRPPWSRRPRQRLSGPCVKKPKRKDRIGASTALLQRAAAAVPVRFDGEEDGDDDNVAAQAGVDDGGSRRGAVGIGKKGSEGREMGEEVEEDEDEDDDDGPHPLRMAEWELVTRSGCWGLFGREATQKIHFDRDGDLLTEDGIAGHWWFGIGGLHWEVVRDGLLHHHRAELHWNVFGDEPRMFRGTVVRDRSKGGSLPLSLPPWLFRPVVATFSGRGVGEDTADTTYQHRQQQQGGGAGGSDSSGNPKGKAPRQPPTRFDRY